MYRPFHAIRFSLACGVILGAAATFDAPAQDRSKAASPVVLVPPFENQTKQHEYVAYEVRGNGRTRTVRVQQVDRYTEAPRSLFEDALTNVEGVTIVERQRVDTLLAEAEFGQLSGLVDADKAIKLGKMIGANLIVIGTVVDVSEETKTFTGYGVATKNTVVNADLRVRILDVESGKVAFSKTVKGTKTYSDSNFGGTKSCDRHFAAVKAAVAAISGDAQFKAAVLGKASADAGLVEVEFAPKPDNCDVEIDGKYVGGSPVKRKLKAGTEYKVRISKAGFKDWSGTITPEAGLKITRELEAVK